MFVGVQGRSIHYDACNSCHLRGHLYSGMRSTTPQLRGFNRSLTVRRNPRSVIHSYEPTSAGPSPVELPAVSTSTEKVGEKLAEWLKSPFDFAAFGPRLTVGALLSAPEKLNSLSDDVQKFTEILNSPAPPEDKSKQVASELELYAPSYYLFSTSRSFVSPVSKAIGHTCNLARFDTEYIFFLILRKQRFNWMTIKK
jgi:hypothetical protein